MKNLKFTTSILLLILITFSCKKENNHQEEITQVDNITMPSGHYVWEFKISAVGKQESHLILYKDSISYVMTGPAYSTNYIMIKESYQNGRWIGVGKGGSIPKDDVYFVMFFKDATDNTVTVYKHECKNGKEEAESFPYPAPDATEDHGWNVYHKK